MNLINKLSIEKIIKSILEFRIYDIKLGDSRRKSKKLSSHQSMLWLTEAEQKDQRLQEKVNYFYSPYYKNGDGIEIMKFEEIQSDDMNYSNCDKSSTKGIILILLTTDLNFNFAWDLNINSIDIIENEFKQALSRNKIRFLCLLLIFFLHNLNDTYFLNSK